MVNIYILTLLKVSTLWDSIVVIRSVIPLQPGLKNAEVIDPNAVQLVYAVSLCSLIFGEVSLPGYSRTESKCTDYLMPQLLKALTLLEGNLYIQRELFNQT